MPTKSNYSAVNNTYNGAGVQSQIIHNMAIKKSDNIKIMVMMNLLMDNQFQV